jgi:hypothetical protein
MKKILPVALILALIAPAVLANISANDLRSEAFSLVATLGNSSEAKFSFNDAQVMVQEISIVPIRSPIGGNCRVKIIINDLLAKIMEWKPSGGIVNNEYGGVNGGRKIVGKWQTPLGIVFTPNDILRVQLSAYGGDKAKGDCSADFLVFGVAPSQQ